MSYEPTGNLGNLLASSTRKDGEIFSQRGRGEEKYVYA
jgi:hypothetical protein